MHKDEKTKERKPQIIFVCTGNTCRSPMAEALFAMILQEHNCADSFRLVSMGLAAFPGDTANPLSVEAMAELGVDISAHRSRGFSLYGLEKGDWVVTMTASQKKALEKALDKPRLLCLGDFAGGDVSDPYGGSIETYRTCRSQLMQALKSFYLFLEQENAFDLKY